MGNDKNRLAKIGCGVEAEEMGHLQEIAGEAN